MQENNNAVPVQPEEPKQEQDKQIDFFKTYASQILTGVLIVAAIGIAIYRYYGVSSSAKQEAAAKLFAARSTQDLESIIEQNSSSPIAPLALLKSAKMHFNQANYDMAMSKYNEFKTKYPQHELIDAAEMGKLHCMEARNQTQESLTGFTAFAAAKTNHFLYAEAIMGQARCLAQLGREKEAITVYEDFIAAHPKSAWTGKMEDLMKALKKKSEGTQPSN